MRLGGVPRLALVVLGASAIAATTASPARAQGTITGRVMVQGSNQPVEEARVIVVGTSIFATSGLDGRYTLRNVPAGAAEVRVLRVGYTDQKKPVSVTNGQVLALDFALVQTVVKLQEVVTTATGELQRRSELGNSVSTIDASKVVATEPVKNIGDLLVAKAPGVQVLPANMTGGASRIRIRGTSSVSLSSAPIYIIDGIRMTANQSGIGVGGTIESRANDINPDEIEDIEIVKGPSAATLYGTDAANGVIVITTKKGHAGAPSWNFYVEEGNLKDRNDYPSQYAILGHAPNSTTVRKCLLTQMSAGTCIMDSTSTLNIFDRPDLTPIKPGWRNQYGLQLSGGTEALRYFTSGEIEREFGTVGMPNFDKQRFQAAKVDILPEWNRPNALNRASARANVNAAVTPTFDLSLQTNFVRIDQRLPQTDNNINSYFFNAMTGPGFTYAIPGTSNVGSLGQPLMGYSSFTPGDIFQQLTNQFVQRFIGSISASWRPLTWLEARGDVGTDLTDQVDHNLCRLGQCSDFGTQREGFAFDVRRNIRNFTSNVGATANWQARTWLGVKSTLGAQYVNYKNDNGQLEGDELPPGAQTPGQGTIPSVDGGTELSKTLGLFIEEQGAIHDRLFLTAALRTDQNSAFGTNFQRVFYPKASISWILSEEPFFPAYNWLNQFRLRASVGASGVQPGPNDALRTFRVVTTVIDGTDIAGLQSSALGNPNLKPERTTEFEGGFDTRLFDRVSFEATYYTKQSTGALINKTIAPSAGTNVTSVLTNLGSVKNAGLEGLITAQLLNQRWLGWDVTLNGSHNSNKLVKLGEGVTPIIGNNTQQRPGYPVSGYWKLPFTYSDANGNGIITANEVTVGDTAVFMGYSQPRDEVAITSGFEVLNRKLRLAAQADYKGGSSLDNREQEFLCQQTNSCPGTSDPNASLFTQARTVASRFTTPRTTTAGFFENLQYWRIREVSATYTLDDRFAQRYLRAKGGTLTLAIRNLHTFTKFTGIDPEANFATGDVGSLQDNLLTQGPPTYYTVRLGLRF
jgi:TonB-linked SusC/RagA family outer membrane protein